MQNAARQVADPVASNGYLPAEVVPIGPAIVGKRTETWGEFVKRLSHYLFFHGIALKPMTNKPNTDNSYARVPWAALAIIASLSIVLYTQHNSNVAADKAQAVQMTELKGQVDKLNALIIQQTTLVQETREDSKVAMDYVAQLRLELARRGIQTQER